jgi:hypothetical protein
MNTSSQLKHLGIATLIAIGLAACGQPGPAENAGKKIDKAAADTGKTIGDAADKMGAKMNDQGTATATVIDDAEITTRVKAAIFAEPGLKTLQISVDTVKGVVTLSGYADSSASITTATTLASSVAGVKSVENKLMTK